MALHFGYIFKILKNVRIYVYTSLRHGPDGSNINVTTLVLSARNLVDDHLSNARSTRLFEGFIHICKSAYQKSLHISIINIIVIFHIFWHFNSCIYN